MMGFRRLIVEGDSLTVIKSVMKKEEDRSVLRPITYHIQRLQQFFEEVTYNFVPRAINSAAHVLALEEDLSSMLVRFEVGEGSLNLHFWLQGAVCSWLHVIVEDVEESSFG
ncbi:hypothetical protein Gotri_014990 [Gossypium trilobum]|uniref:RNase H type-1 domain-containing protein n=1 Tax=Gossypium trilobum TaxID=34281 RepID=A0A7J9DYS2_9ROSI|nr:hypothetical protein [Gossypium trilobum]